MPLSQQEQQNIIQELTNTTGMPAAFQGDRIDAYVNGLIQAIKALASRVSIDQSPPPKGAEPK